MGFCGLPLSASPRPAEQAAELLRRRFRALGPSPAPAAGNVDGSQLCIGSGEAASSQDALAAPGGGHTDRCSASNSREPLHLSETFSVSLPTFRYHAEQIPATVAFPRSSLGLLLGEVAGLWAPRLGCRRRETWPGWAHLPCCLCSGITVLCCCCPMSEITFEVLWTVFWL